MKRVFTSLQFRLFAVVALLLALAGALSLFSTQSLIELERNADRLEAAGLQRSRPYLLASLARRLTSSDDEGIRQSLGRLIRSTLDAVNETQQALRLGGTGEFLGSTGEHEVIGITQPELLPLLDTLDAEITHQNELFVTFLASSRDQQLEQLTEIDDHAVVIYTFADRLAQGLDVITEQQVATTQQNETITVLIALFGGGVAILTVIQITRSVRELANLAHSYAKGNLTAQAPQQVLIEISQVSNALSTMAERLQRNILDLEHTANEAQDARRKAERSEQVKSAFLASMSHELRTPLNAIINFTRFVAEGDVGPVNDRQSALLRDVISSGDHLLSLINDVLDMSKIEAGSLTLFVEDNVDLKAIITSVVSNGRALLMNKDVELLLAVPDNLPPIRADRHRILQILLNLMSNACKFTENGHIKLSAYTVYDEVIISIEDTGPGIPAEDHAAVFEAFKQTESGLRQGGGTGLGMPIARSLAEAHGGKLWLASTPGKGTTFSLALPIRSGALQPVFAA